MAFYGLIKDKHAEEFVKAICDVLGYGKNKTADKLLIETAMAETLLGAYRDETIFGGMGLTQFDALPFEDVKIRTSKKDKDLIKRHWDIDLDLVEWNDLRYNPFLSLLFTRLKYKLIPQEIPLTLEDRATYWKKYYNSLLGKGTVQHYITVNTKDYI